MTNRCTLAQLRDMTLEQASGLPVDQIAALLEDVAEQKADTKRLDDLLQDVLTLRYAEPAAAERRANGKDTGTVTLRDGEFVIKADLPKRVDWDDDKLAETEAKLREMGEDPGEYLKVKRVVSEAAYGNWPSSLRTMFEPARTVGVGRATYKVERAKVGRRAA